MVHFEKALRSPGSVYDSPEQVLSDPRLDREGKRAILKSWEQDARELAVAEDENMAGGEPDLLGRVLEALAKLPDKWKDRTAAPTKHGGAADPILRNDRDGPSRVGRRLVGGVMDPIAEVLHPDHLLGEALTRMLETKLTLLPVVDGDEVVGCLTAEDVVDRGTKQGEEWRQKKVADEMTRQLFFCYVDDDLQSAKEIMENSSCERLLVVDRQAHLQGTISLQAIASPTSDMPRKSRKPEGARQQAEGRAVRTAGRAKGCKPGSPGLHSVKPKIQR